MYLESIFDISKYIFNNYCSRDHGVLTPTDALYVSAIMSQAVMRGVLTWKGKDNQNKKSNFISSTLLSDSFIELSSVLSHQFSATEINSAITIMKDDLKLEFRNEKQFQNNRDPTGERKSRDVTIIYSQDRNLNSLRVRMRDAGVSFNASADCFTVLIWYNMFQRIRFERNDESSEGVSA